MSHNNSDSSTSESEVSACSSSFNPIKALYSSKAKVPVESAPMYENVDQFEAALKKSNEVYSVGQTELVKKRGETKEKKRLEEEKLLHEKNEQRFARYRDNLKIEGIEITSIKKTIANLSALEENELIKTQSQYLEEISSITDMLPARKEFRSKNLLTRMANMEGPLGVLKECVDHRLRLKIITRNATGVRGYLHATLVAFDKQWNMALSDILEVWKRKGPRKRKVPPGLGTPVAKGTAASISTVPEVTETPLGKGIWECSRYVPQMMVRGEHIVLVNVVER